MGAESYLIEVIFKNPVPHTEIINLLVSSGSTYLPDKSNSSPIDSYRSYYFEIRNDLGLTELYVQLSPKQEKINRFFLRFSILSPHTVIDQSIDYLIKLRNKEGIMALYADGSSKELELDVGEFKLNRKRNRILQTIISNETGLIIEGGDTTTHHIYENNLVERVWGKQENAAYKMGRSWWQKLFRL